MSTSRRRILSIDTNDIPEQVVPYYELPLFIEAHEKLSVSFSAAYIEYSLDNSNWTQFTKANVATPSISAGERIYFRAKNLTATSANGIGGFSITGKCEVGGNALSMVWGKDFLQYDTLKVQYNLKKLFYKATTIISAEKMIVACKSIPADGCHAMFAWCTSLKRGCSLPATSLKKYAYCAMYQGCDNLEVGSDLPATDVTGATYCYNGMYAWCPKLKYLKSMLLTPPPNNDNVYGAQTGNWLLDVSSTGTFVKNSKATWNLSGEHGIPSGWTVLYADE